MIDCCSTSVHLVAVVPLLSRRYFTVVSQADTLTLRSQLQELASHPLVPGAGALVPKVHHPCLHEGVEWVYSRPHPAASTPPEVLLVGR